MKTALRIDATTWQILGEALLAQPELHATGLDAGNFSTIAQALVKQAPFVACSSQGFALASDRLETLAAHAPDADYYELALEDVGTYGAELHALYQERALNG